MADNETIADVIAEMRKTYVSKGGAGYCGEVWIDLLRYADRLEAAHRRERGDCAKLRETVKETQAVIARCMDILNRIPDSCGYGELIDDVADELCALREDHIKSALSAPPRNCDRPECATTKAAQDVWRKEDGGKTAYYEWLLATYKEGGNDGR
jgi:hypothetical protein